MEKYKQTFTLAPHAYPEDFERVIRKKISYEQNSILVRIPMAAEIDAMVKKINSNKLPGTDGLPGSFFTTYWPIVKEDIIAVVSKFFESDRMLGKLNEANLVLIQKVKSPGRLNDYRTISFYNFVYKIISKLLGAS